MNRLHTLVIVAAFIAVGLIVAGEPKLGSAQAYNQARDLHDISVTLKEIARTLKDKCP
jgi:hypothetical protein